MKKLLAKVWAGLVIIALFVASLLPAWAQEDPYTDLWSKIDGSTATLPLTEAIMINRLGGDGKAISPTHSKTYNAYRALLKGEKDLIFVPLPTQIELESLAQDLGTEEAPLSLPELTYRQVVKEGLVFITNGENPVKRLTNRQLRDIYMGRVQNWKEVGGKDEAILPFQRNPDSGSQTAFLQLLMEGQKPMHAEAGLTQGSMGYLVESIASYDNSGGALGYSMYFYVSEMYGKENLRFLEVDGVPPTRETIGNGTYPLVMGYYAVYRSELPENHPARQLTDWLVSPEGQAVAAEAGYVPLDEKGGVAE